MRNIGLDAHCDCNIGDDVQSRLPQLATAAIAHANPQGGWGEFSSHKAILANGKPIAVVSSGYTLVDHRQVFGTTHDAVAGLNIGRVIHGIYADRQGRKIRILYKFPDLTDTMPDGNAVCPVVRVTNSVDATTRIRIEIGAFRFVCTNFAIGGGGVFTGGFAAIHRGVIELDTVRDQIRQTLDGFPRICDTFRAWHNMPPPDGILPDIGTRFGERHAERLQRTLRLDENRFQAYNELTKYGSHTMRSASRAFEFLAWVNQKFQQN